MDVKYGYVYTVKYFDIVLVLLSAVAGVLLFISGVLLLNKVPAQWLCDYDEQPTEDMLQGNRFKGKALYILVVCFRQ